MAGWHPLVTLLCLTSLTVISVKANTAYCTYEHITSYSNDLMTDNRSGYLCKLDLDVKGDRVNHIGGNHENGERSSQVNIIKVLPSFYTYLTSFPDTFCMQFDKLEIIDMSGTEIETIEENSLEKCKDLKILQFYMNNIKEVPENLLKNNKKLLRLHISFNSITTLPGGLVLGLSNLEILDLSYNKLEALPVGIFEDLRSLKDLNLEGNHIKTLDKDLLKNLENLEKLNLGSNAISELPSAIFSNLHKLNDLVLKINQLTVIHANSFPKEAKINSVSLSKNKIDAIDKHFINSCGISNLKMGGNICDKTVTIAKKDLRKKLEKCFQNYDEFYRESTTNTEEETTTTTMRTTTICRTRRPRPSRTTTSKPIIISTTTEEPLTEKPLTEVIEEEEVISTTEKPTTVKTTTTTQKPTTTTTSKPPTTTTITEPPTTTTEKPTTTTTEATTTIKTEPITTTAEITTTQKPIIVTPDGTQTKLPTLQAVHEPCGVAKVGVPNIVGGEEISPNTHPWIAALIYEGRYFCGGTLVTNRKIVTAAHCILAKGSDEKEAEGILVILGGHNLENPMEVGRLTVGVQSIQLHNNWNPLNEKFDADIAVLVLDDDVEFSYYIQPACMARIVKPFISYTVGVIVGYGKSETSRSHENVPKKANTPVRTATDCYREFPKLNNIASHRTFCGGFANGTGSCTGDSGGGLTVISDGRHFLRGIVSSSLYADKYGCDVNSYSLFSDMRYYAKFVNDIKV